MEKVRKIEKKSWSKSLTKESNIKNISSRNEMPTERGNAI